MCVGFSGCLDSGDGSQSNEEKRFVGTWITEDENSSYCLGPTMMFFSNGTTIIPNSFYEIRDEELVIISNNIPDGLVFDYYFTDNDKKLELTSKNCPSCPIYTVIYTKI